MKPAISLTLAVLVVATAALLARQAPAVTGPVAFVSAQRIQAETADGKALVARLQTLQRERTADIRAKQQALEATRSQVPMAKDDATRARLQGQESQQRADLEKALTQSQTDVQAMQRQGSAELAGKVRGALQEILKGSPAVQVVLNGDSSVVWAQPGHDLTAAVVAHMDAQKPKPQ